MKKELFRVETNAKHYEEYNKAIFEHIGEQEWFFSDKHVKGDIKSGELVHKNGIAIIYDID